MSLRARVHIIIYTLTALLLLAACGSGNSQLNLKAKVAGGGESDWETLLEGGELIAVALQSPDTYYDEAGSSHGLQYALAADFASQYGLRLRVERVEDEAEVLRMVADGEADLSISPIAEEAVRGRGLEAAGAWMQMDSLRTTWAVSRQRPGLMKALRGWFVDGTVERVLLEQRMDNEARSKHHHVIAPPMLDRGRGIVSTYDEYFREAAAREGLDWRLLAAIGYAESAFDPGARSRAGAMGMMQLMPATARQYGVSDPYDARSNIGGGASLMRQLIGNFSDIPTADERTKFALASYNGGEGHIRDAQALCRKYGGDPTRWSDVRDYVLRLGQMPYKTDPVVRHGGMNGSETANYVSIVTSRYNSYGGHLSHSSNVGSAPTLVAAPQPVQREAPRLTADHGIAPAPLAATPKDRRPNRFTEGNRVRPADDPAFNAVEREVRQGE